jgi:hypothetical protein
VAEYRTPQIVSATGRDDVDLTKQSDVELAVLQARVERPDNATSSWYGRPETRAIPPVTASIHRSAVTCWRWLVPSLEYDANLAFTIVLPPDQLEALAQHVAAVLEEGRAAMMASST